MRARLGTLTIEMLHQIGFIGNSIWNRLLEVIWKKFLMVLININSDGIVNSTPTQGDKTCSRLNHPKQSLIPFASCVVDVGHIVQ